MSRRRIEQGASGAGSFSLRALQAAPPAPVAAPAGAVRRLGAPPSVPVQAPALNFRFNTITGAIPQAPKPPEPPWKTFEPAGDSRRERKEPDRLEGGRAPNPVELKRQFEEMREKGDTRPPSEAFKRQKA